MVKFKIGDEIEWLGVGSQKGKKFYGKLLEQPGFERFVKVRANSGQGMIIDEGYLDRNFIRRRRR